MSKKRIVKQNNKPIIATICLSVAMVLLLSAAGAGVGVHYSDISALVSGAAVVETAGALEASEANKNAALEAAAADKASALADAAELAATEKAAAEETSYANGVTAGGKGKSSFVRGCTDVNELVGDTFSTATDWTKVLSYTDENSYLSGSEWAYKTIYFNTKLSISAVSNILENTFELSDENNVIALGTTFDSPDKTFYAHRNQGIDYLLAAYYFNSSSNIDSITPSNFIIWDSLDGFHYSQNPWYIGYIVPGIFDFSDEKLIGVQTLFSISANHFYGDTIGQIYTSQLSIDGYGETFDLSSLETLNGKTVTFALNGEEISVDVAADAIVTTSDGVSFTCQDSEGNVVRIFIGPGNVLSVDSFNELEDSEMQGGAIMYVFYNNASENFAIDSFEIVSISATISAD